jgi:hypothetical protein
MTLTLTRKMKARPRKVKDRKAALAGSGHNYRDLAGLSRVTYSMVWKWMNDERTSTTILAAYNHLVANPKNGTRS